MNLKFRLIIGILFVLSGAFVLSPEILRDWQDRHAQPFTAAIKAAAAPANNNAASNVISGPPSHLTLPGIGISVDVEPGYYNSHSQTWSLSLTKAEFATITSQPNNQSGDTFIYGHNRPEVFEKLLNAKVGDEAVLQTTNKHTFTYRLSKVDDVSPTDTSLFAYKGKPVLTLQTCSGAWYQHRRLFTFTLESVT